MRRTADEIDRAVAQGCVALVTVEFEYDIEAFALKEAQLDRCLVRLSLGYPAAEEESAMLSRLQHKQPIDDLEPVVSAEDIVGCQQAVRSVRVDEKVNRYIVELIRRMRGAGDETDLADVALHIRLHRAEFSDEAIGRLRAWYCHFKAELATEV